MYADSHYTESETIFTIDAIYYIVFLRRFSDTVFIDRLYWRSLTTSDV